jgi:hypothetical protein
MGPIFLLIYLPAEPQQPTWLMWWGLGLTLLSVPIALYGTKIGANTLFHRYTEDDPDDPNVDDSYSFAGHH